MKQKLISKLKELFPNLGLSESIFENVGAMVVGTLAQDADDAAIEAAAKGCESLLKAFQSDTDKRVTDAVKKAKGDKGGETKPEGGAPSTDSEVLKMLKEMKESQEAEKKDLLDRIAALEGKNAEKNFDALVAKIAGEMGYNSAMLDRAKRGLSSDMDETKIKEELGAFKKFMVENGAHFDEQGSPDTVQADDLARQEAEKWVQEHAVK